MNEQTDQRDIRVSIRTALYSISDSDFSASAKKLLDTLGYESQRTLPDQTGKVDDFINTFPAYLRGDTNTRNMKSDEILCNNIDHIRFLFQFTDDEIAASDNTQLNMLFSETNEFDESWVKSFFFVVAELRDKSYPRGKYAQLTREINKRFSQPAVVLFKTPSNLLTLAFVHRREHKRNPERDVLGKVSLIRQIDPNRPHRAHLDILSELSLFECLLWMDAKKQKHNFDGLLAAWLDKLNTDKLNQKFYKELFNWFIRAVNESKFPTDKARILTGEEHIIRLITRLLFVWFIKQKGLVSDDLFNEAKVNDLLVGYDQEAGDSYYRAVLQNLFFATLNTDIKKRGFSIEKNATHRNFSLYRYSREIRDKKKLVALFARTPFINGGLFDCLDSEKATTFGGYRIDCFSDVHYKKLSIPNRLFFDEDGLFPLLNRYKFTVEENTPIEQEVALDPELLGRVFENLLAAYNPETRETARKQTGSYYTPRSVVDYMVDEALVASLAVNATPKDNDMEFWEDRLRYLLDYKDAFDDASELFEKEESESIINAIAEIKVLDPAVGSGAFPMGILHKLTLALQRIDPDNQYWQTLQKERAKRRADKAFDTKDHEARDAELLEISEIFERYSSDFGRKLYLIQNSIFGVDIQPVACQIAKLRFFISLAIEQELEPKAQNFGIKPLPNLETRFVTANSLLCLGRHIQLTLRSDAIAQIERELNNNRERYFHATQREEKLYYKNQDALLRKKLADELQKASFTAKDADQIAQWDLYDQNNTADWFDAEYMLGVVGGFDIVIGNPPYVRADSSEQHLEMRQKIVDTNQYETLWEKWDLYIPFIERSYKLLKPGGVTTMIVSDAYCHSKYAKKSQEWFLKNSLIRRFDFFSKIKIFDAAVRNITYLFQKADGSNNKPERRVHDPEFGIVKLLPTDIQSKLTYRVFFPEDITFQQIHTPTVPLKEICYITKGMVVHAHESKADVEFELKNLVSDTVDKIHPKPFVEGKHLARWLPATNKWLEWGTGRAPDLFSRPTFPEIYESTEKLLSVDMAAGVDKLRVVYDSERLYHNHSVWSFVPWQTLSGVRNRSIKKQTRYNGETPKRPDLPKREELEETSQRFSIKFLLGVMNSNAARDYLRANRRSNIHLYPDDWKKLPIPDATPSQQAPIIKLVDQILEAKRMNPDADISTLEININNQVDKLYKVK